MVSRQKMLLNLIYGLGAPTSLQVQKIMFIMRFDATLPPYYDFIPNDYGCYSVALHADQRTLERRGLIKITKSEDPTLTQLHIEADVDMKNYSLKREESNVLTRILRAYGSKSNADLITLTYHMKPQYAYKSCLLSSFSSEAEFMKKIESVKAKIDSSEHCIYTIGYEGLSIDTFLKQLIMKNVALLIDVRKNAFSMRPEYMKKSLQTALQSAGIEYLHRPEVGIMTAKRTDLTDENKRSELFDWYQLNVLPTCGDFVSEVSSLFHSGNIAFMCYEKNPKECHRSFLASYCLESKAEFNKVVHL